MFGRLKDGPAKSNARAGPEAIPLAINACNIGISVNVEKYINAPNIEAIKLPVIVFCPTNLSIIVWGSKGL